MSEFKKLLKNTGLIGIGNISVKLVSFLLLPLYTSILSTSEYGIIDYITSLTAFCVPFVSLLMDESVFRFLIDCKTDDEKTQAMSVATMLVLLGCGAFLVVAVPIFIKLQYKYAVHMSLYLIASVMASMINAIARGIGRTDKFVIYNSLMGISTVILNVMLVAVFRWGVSGMLLAGIISQLGIALMAFVQLKLWRYIDFKRTNRSMAREMIVYSLPLIPNKVSWAIINLSDRLLIMNIIGSDASGIYAVAHKFPNLMDTVYGFFYQSWKESSARIIKDEGYVTFYNTVYEYLKSFLFAIVVGMTAFMPVIYRFMIDSNYHSAMIYVPILLLATYFSNMSGFYGGVFTAYKNTKIMGITTIVAAFINLVINLSLIHTMGLFAAAISTLVANYVVYEFRKRKVRQYVILKENCKSTVFAVVCLAVIWVLFYMDRNICTAFGCILSVFFALIANRKLLRLIFHRRVGQTNEQ